MVLSADPSACHTCVALLQEATKPWRPSTHFLFGPRLRNHVVSTLVLAKRLAVERKDLPPLPREIWHRIISFIGREVEDTRRETLV